MHAEQHPEVREEVRRHYVAYKRRTNFVDAVPQKHRLLARLNMRFGETDDPRGFAADITNLGLWGRWVRSSRSLRARRKSRASIAADVRLRVCEMWDP